MTIEWLSTRQAEAFERVVDYLSQDVDLAQDYLDSFDEGIGTSLHLWEEVAELVNAIDGTSLTPVDQARATVRRYRACARASGIVR